MLEYACASVFFTWATHQGALLVGAVARASPHWLTAAALGLPDVAERRWDRVTGRMGENSSRCDVST